MLVLVNLMAPVFLLLNGGNGWLQLPVYALSFAGREWIYATKMTVLVRTRWSMLPSVMAMAAGLAAYLLPYISTLILCILIVGAALWAEHDLHNHGTFGRVCYVVLVAMFPIATAAIPTILQFVPSNDGLLQTSESPEVLAGRYLPSDGDWATAVGALQGKADYDPLVSVMNLAVDPRALLYRAHLSLYEGDGLTVLLARWEPATARPLFKAPDVSSALVYEGRSATAGNFVCVAEMTGYLATWQANDLGAATGKTRDTVSDVLLIALTKGFAGSDTSRVEFTNPYLAEFNGPAWIELIKFKEERQIDALIEELSPLRESVLVPGYFRASACGVERTDGVAIHVLVWDSDGIGGDQTLAEAARVTELTAGQYAEVRRPHPLMSEISAYIRNLHLVFAAIVVILIARAATSEEKDSNI